MAGPIWNRFMQKALGIYPPGEGFVQIEPGPEEEINPHSIIHYLNENPELNPQYQNWEEAIQSRLKQVK